MTATLPSSRNKVEKHKNSSSQAIWLARTNVCIYKYTYTQDYCTTELKSLE